jgi:hypothetical protein
MKFSNVSKTGFRIKIRQRVPKIHDFSHRNTYKLEILKVSKMKHIYEFRLFIKNLLKVTGLLSDFPVSHKIVQFQKITAIFYEFNLEENHPFFRDGKKCMKLLSLKTKSKSTIKIFFSRILAK